MILRWSPAAEQIDDCSVDVLRRVREAIVQPIHILQVLGVVRSDERFAAGVEFDRAMSAPGVVFRVAVCKRQVRAVVVAVPRKSAPVRGYGKASGRRSS